MITGISKTQDSNADNYSLLIPLEYDKYLDQPALAKGAYFDQEVEIGSKRSIRF